MADVRHEAEAPPPVPGFWRLGWLLFMQPLTLHRLFATWELKNPSLWELRGRLKRGDSVVRILVNRMASWLLVAPVSAVMIAATGDLAGLPVNWNAIAIGVIMGIIGGAAVGAIGSLALGIIISLLLTAVPIMDHAGIDVGITVGIGTGISVSIGYGLSRGLAFDAIGAIIGGIFIAYSDSKNGGISFSLTLLRLPLYSLEFTCTALFCMVGYFYPAALPQLALWLPYRHHDLIYFPLPFLAGFLVRLGENYPEEGRQALIEATVSVAQEEAARRALVELQARSLERAARERRYASTAALTLPFLPERESLATGEFKSGHIGYLVAINSIAAAAQDLEAARSTGSHHQRRQALSRARRELEQILYFLNSARPTRAERRFLPVVKGWLDRVDDEEAALARLERDQPQVPLVFVAGVPLTPMDESLFVGRRDLVSVLDQDLAAERPVPLVLLGQRRMGKSTLLNFLPRLLGTGTRVVHLNFQRLSGSPFQGEPHRWVATEVAAALVSEKIETISAPSEGAPWGATLDWLTGLEEPLAASGRRLLIALDEVEGLERGIRERWSDPSFLDFLRAAGDRLRRIRFLLVTAHPFSRLGPHWSDRLISAQTRRIEPLREEEARALLVQPVPGFPDIYPPGGVERLLTETACHPYLLQLTAYHLTRRLNEAGRLKATDDDITAALDQALEENNLFQYLWDDLTAAEQRLVAVLARGEEPMEEAAETLSQARRELVREQLIQRGGNGEDWRVTVPLFARWIREIGAAG